MLKNKLALLIAFICAIFLILYYQESFRSIDLKLQDVVMQDGRSVDPRIAILAIDDESLKEIGQWPWSRDVHAQLVERLSDGDAAVIGFDITFPLPSTNPADDDRFIKAVKEAENVILPRYGLFDQYAKQGMIESIELSEPFEALKEAAKGLGHLNTITDSDGVVRKALYQFSYQGELIDSFSWTIAQTYAEKMNMTYKIDGKALNDFYQFHIDYAGEPGDYEIIPYSYVLSGDVSPNYFANRIVLVGPYTVGIKDDFLTPTSGKQTMYGVEIHANIIQNILEENYHYSFSWGWNAFLLVLFSIIAYFINQFKSPIISLFLTALTGGIIILTSKILYNNGWVVSIAYVLLLLGVTYIASVAYNYIAELTERKRITSIFGRYVAPQVVLQILSDGEEGLKLGGTRKNITVMFVDIRGFTTLSESVEPEEIVAILNEYLDLTATSIFDYGGTLDKFIGDATMAIYNAPIDLENHELQAVKTAYAMQQGSIELERQLQNRFGKSVKFGIGIHTGPAVVGNIGSKSRMDYTAIGDTVNTAARLESNSKPGQVILSEEVYEKVKDDVIVKSLGVIQVKGKVNGVTIFELEGLRLR